MRANRDSAIARSRRRCEERGVAVFIVVMVLTLVTAIGVFSMRSASLVDVATGFNRQSVQATAQAEFAARAAATYIGDDQALVYSTTRVPGCAPALQAADPNAPCNVLKTSLLNDVYTSKAPHTFNDGLPGMLSMPVAGDSSLVQAEFVTELTEPGPASVVAAAGFPAGQFTEITLTSIARVYPTDATATSMCSTGARGSVSQQTVRAHIIVPPAF
jgi:Tfp pilus assembly protein PilX